MDRYIVECSFDKPFTDEEDKATAGAVEGYLSSHGGRWVRSYYSKDRLRMVCEFESPDTDTLVQAWEGAGCPFVSVWPAQVFEAEAVGAKAEADEVRWDG